MHETTRCVCETCLFWQLLQNGSVSSIKSGTYGGHLELSAFAHLNKRDVKVIQPGLVYVIEWAAGNPLDPPTPSSPQTSDGPQLDERERRRLRREKRRSEKDKSFGSIEASEQMPVYVAYVPRFVSSSFHVITCSTDTMTGNTSTR